MTFAPFTADPNVNIVWTENVDGKMVALRDIEEGPLFLLAVEVIIEHVIFTSKVLKLFP